MKEKKTNKENKRRVSLVFITIINFFIILMLSLYIIYLRFIPYETLTYDGYAVSGKEITNNLLDATFEVDENVLALKVKDQDMVFKNLKSYYIGASKTQNINLEYPIYVNDNLALYNLSQDVSLITSDLEVTSGYKGFTLTSGNLYNSSTLERADFCDYILMRNAENLYINTKVIKIKTYSGEYKIPMNSIMNITNKFITYYSLNGDYFVYNKILDIDDNSQFIIEDYNKQYTYRELLIALGIIREETPKEIIKEDTTKEEKENKEEEIEEQPIEEAPITDVVEDTNNNGEVKWIKPEVKATDFTASTYIAYNEVEIYDPSGVICKSPTFTFYKDGKISFRKATNSSGRLDITKLCPNTTYEVEGIYQYLNQDEEKIEVTFYKGSFTTLGTENIKPIDLIFENGEIYENKIELKNFGITSDITDEAIYGVVKAVIEINGVEYKINSSKLKQMLKGDRITYETEENLASNTKYKYEIKFYDTNNNEMKLNNNKGETNTLKAVPTVKITTKNGTLKTTITTTLRNDDKVDVTNFRYELLTSDGELVKQGELKQDKDKIVLRDLELEKVYIINVFGDYDIEDGNGVQYNKLLGTQTFITDALKGKLKLNISSDEEKLTNHEASLDISIINKEDDDATIKEILKSFKIKLRNDETGEIEQEIVFDSQQMSDFKNEENVKINIKNLESNTKYIILVEAIVNQGGKNKKIDTSYNFNEIITKKSAATMSVSNVVVTDNFLDLKFIIDDKDNTIGDDKERLVTIKLEKVSSNGNTEEIEKIDKYLNIEGYEFELEYSGLEKEGVYKLTCIASKYNESQDTSNIQNSYLIGRADREKDDEDYNYFEFETVGLTGTVMLNSLKEEIKLNEDGSYVSDNLVNIKSKNNWYSECFDVLDKGYNYKKIYDESTNTLTLGSNQSYAYNLNNYGLTEGTTIKMSFKAMTNHEKAKVKIQNAKNMGNNILKDDKGKDIVLNVNNSEYSNFSYEFNVGEDGYVGFYLPTIAEENLFDGELEQGAGYGDISTIRTKNLIEVKAGRTYKFTSNNYTDFKYIFNTGATNAYPWSDLGYCGNSAVWSTSTDGITFEAIRDGYLGLIISKKDESEISVEDLSKTEIRIEELVTDYELYVRDLQIKVVHNNEDNNEYQSYEGELNLNVGYSLLENQEFTKLQNYYVRLSHVEGENTIKDADICDIEVESDDIKDSFNKAIEEQLRYVIENRPTEQTDFKLELIVKLYDREYVLDEVNFTYIPGSSEEIDNISGIGSESDEGDRILSFRDIQPDGSYFLSEDINLENADTENKYTFGNENISFNGIINFNGKTLRKDTYSDSLKKDITPYVFYKISNTAKIQNLVIDYSINNVRSKNYESVSTEEEIKNGTYALFLYNEGEISNVILNLKECEKIERKYVGLLGYNNKGTIDKFVINLDRVLYGTQYISGCVLYSSGIIQNGYIKGQGFESYGSITNTDTRYFAGVVYKATNSEGNESRGIKNVYNNTKIKLHYIEELGTENAFAANIAYSVDENTYVQNVYSINSVEVTREKMKEEYKSLDINKREVENGPNVFKVYKKDSSEESTNNKISNSFYFSETYYSNSINIQGNISSLTDTKYQTDFLGDYGFEFKENYYPIVKMNSCMPAQSWIQILGSGKDNINILSAETIKGENTEEIIKNINGRLEETFGLGEVITGENGIEVRIKQAIEEYENQNNVKVTDENIYVAEISLYNSRNSDIDEENGIDIDFVDEHILGQGKGNQRTLLYVIVDNPQVYYNKYNISRISYKTWRDGEYKTVDQSFGANETLGKKEISMKFIKEIANAEEWCKIDQDTTDAEGNSLGVSGLVQNYRLVSDIDFENGGSPAISGIFEGEIIGKKIQVEEEEKGVKKVVTRYPILKNISLSQNFIEILNGKFENVNVENFEQTELKEVETDNKYYLGFIGSTSKEAIIDNIHLKNVKLEYTHEVTNSNANCYIGGIICEMKNNSIKNSSVSGLTLECIEETANKQFYMALGGIVGYASTTEKTIENCYVQDFMINLGSNINSIGIGGILGNSDSVKTTINYCYTTGNINTYQNNIGGIFGRNTSGATRCYSAIDITSNSTAISTGSIGGIGGYCTTAEDNKYNVYIGNMYVKKAGMNNINNIIGASGDKAADTIKTATQNNNYAYSGQRINGMIDENSTYAYGAKLITSVSKRNNEIDTGNTVDTRTYTDTAMKTKGTYYNSAIINSAGIIVENMPLLYENNNSSNDERKLMIWQKDVGISTVSLKVLNVSAEIVDSDTYDKNSETKPSAEITLTINNPDGIKITGLVFESIDTIQTLECEGVTEQIDNSSTKNSEVKFKVTPNFYYDTYKINSLKYESKGEEKDFIIDTKVTVTFYKGVRKWEDFDYKNTYQNYKILNDMDLNDKDNNVGPEKTNDGFLVKNKKDNKDNKDNMELIVGRLVGQTSETGEKRKIGGTSEEQKFDFKLDEARTGLIKECSVVLENISFENINITSTADNIGIFAIVTANCKNIDFKNIKISASGRSYIGAIAQANNATFNNIKLDKIDYTAGSYTGGLCGAATLSGTNDGICATNTSVSGKDFVGGLIGRTYNTNGDIKNISAYQKEETNTTLPSDGFLVKGTGSYVGGCIGYSSKNIDTVTTKYSRIIGGSEVGACVGIGYWTAKKNLIAENNYISGWSYVGAVMGTCDGYVNSVSSKNNTVTGTSSGVGGVFGRIRYSEIGTGEIISEKNTVTGGAGNVGGVAGYAQTYYSSYPIRNVSSKENNVYGKNSSGTLQNNVGGIFGYVEQNNSVPVDGIVGINNKVEGGNNVGGAIGYSSAIIRNVQVKGKRNANNIDVSGKSYVGGIVGFETYSYYNSSSTYYSINQAHVSNMYIKGEGNYLGGIAGKAEGTIYGTYINDSTIRNTLQNSKYTGGITGYYTGSTKTSSQYISSKNFYLKNSACVDVNINIEKGEYIGGITGGFKYGNIESCYVSECKIKSTTNNSTGIGGFVGHLENEKTQTNQYISKIKNNYIINKNTTLEGYDYVGGVIGKMDRAIESDRGKNTNNFKDNYPTDVYGSNLIITNITASGDNVSMGIGNYMQDSGSGTEEETIKIDEETSETRKTPYTIGNQNLNMVNTYIYLGNYINANRVDGVDNIFKNKIESDGKYELIDYSWLNKEDNYNKKLEFTSFNLENIKNKYMPILKSPSNWKTIGVSQKNIDFPDEIYFSLSTSTQSFAMPTMLDVTEEVTINTSVKEQFPEVYVYASDVDKINVEFEYINSDIAYSIYNEDGDELFNGNITDRIITFNFDFKQSLKIKLSNGIVWYEENIDIEDIRNKLDIKDDEYIYILNNKLNSNKKEYDGEYVNLYDGKVLSKDGKVYDISDINTSLREYTEFSKVEEAIPIAQYDYQNKKIKTYYHCTKVIDTNGNEVIKDKQMYIKNKSMYILDGKLDIIGNTVVVDSYNDKQYETALGVDGKIYNFLNNIKYPLNFKNKDIIGMTSNIKNDDNIILVYYSSGKVIGFNYITGEEVYNNGEGKVDLITYIANSLSKENLLYDIENVDYEEEMELIEKLEQISIDEAMQQINENDTDMDSESDENEKNNNEVNNNITSHTSEDIQYVVSYDVTQNKYVVYSSEEVFNTEKEEILSENEKIQSNAKLENYYGNLSVSKIELNNIGIILFTIVIISIGTILVVMKKKNLKD